MAAAAYRAAVAEATAAGTSFGDIDSASLNLTAQVTSRFVEKIEVAGGLVVITYGGAADRKLNGQQVALVPGLLPGGDVVWTCGLAAVPDGVTAAVRAHRQYTNVPEKYLPSACRGK